MSCSALVYAQNFKNSYALGVGYHGAWQVGGDDNIKYNSLFEFSGEAQFSKYSGIALDLGVRHFEYKGMLHGKQNYMLLRFGYKFYSDIVNFRAGFSADVFSSETDRVGFHLSVSKDIALCGDKWFFEPEVRYELLYNTKDRMWLGGHVKDERTQHMLGVGAKLKYKF